MFGRTEDGHEAHVDRHLNVIGSGAMHSGLFEVHTAMVKSIFDHDDFDKQPAFLIDMVGHPLEILKYRWRAFLSCVHLQF